MGKLRTAKCACGKEFTTTAPNRTMCEECKKIYDCWYSNHKKAMLRFNTFEEYRVYILKYRAELKARKEATNLKYQNRKRVIIEENKPLIKHVTFR